MPGPFVSFAQNREDVVLWRALRGVAEGRYVEVGANHPRTFSVTRGFYDRGWSGITVEPVPTLAALHRAERPRDTQVEAAVVDVPAGTPGGTVTLHRIGDTGLSTLDDHIAEGHTSAGYAAEDLQVPARRLDEVLASAGWSPADDLHFVVVDVEGAEGAVLRSVDLRTWRPWVLVVEATEPRTTAPTHGAWEPDLLAAGYRFCLFDGLSRFYVAEEHADRLGPLLSYPACPLDEYDTDLDLQRRATIDGLTEDLVRWRSAALGRWADAVASASAPPPDGTADHLRGELEAMRRTVSWRVTAPLRAVRRRAATR
ncbi:FkbM family methyltransferase [Cellulomonas marina]|nr:FkbM family methyltransferase [Cellulomonas marina]